MKFSRLFTAISCVAIASAALAAQDREAFPAPSTLSPSMAETVAAPLVPLWQMEPKTIAEWEKLTGDYAKAAGAAALKLAEDFDVNVKAEKIANVPVHVLTPKTIAKDKEKKVIFYIHGGGYVLGHGVSGITEAIPMTAWNGYRSICVDYRMAPQHPFPAAIDDAFAAYKEVVKQYGAENIAVFGTSTGGAMVLILALQAHAAGVPMPAALISGTPWADLDKVGDSYFVNAGVDNVLGNYDHMIKAAALAYANGHDMKDPLLSPVYADDESLKDFPPTLLISGTRDLFLSNTVRMHTRLLLNEAPSELIVYEALSHAQYYLNMQAPETRDHYRLMGDFLKRVWSKN